MELKEYLVYLKVGETFDPDAYLKNFLVRGDEIDVSGRIPDGVYYSVDNQVSGKRPGIYTVTYNLTTTVNQMTFSGQAVLIVIVEE